MKYPILFIIFTLVIHAGFFNEQSAKEKEEYLENARLCKVFTRKAEDYKAKLRDDFLAKASLASYMHRKDLFCKKAKESKASLENTSKDDNNLTL